MARKSSALPEMQCQPAQSSTGCFTKHDFVREYFADAGDMEYGIMYSVCVANKDIVWISEGEATVFVFVKR